MINSRRFHLAVEDTANDDRLMLGTHIELPSGVTEAEFRNLVFSVLARLKGVPFALRVRVTLTPVEGYSITDAIDLIMAEAVRMK